MSKKKDLLLYFWFSKSSNEKKKKKRMSGPYPHKPLANMFFNQHGGRRGVRSATNVGDKILKRQSALLGGNGIRPGPMGMGLISPSKPTQILSGQGSKQFSHLHQIHEKYNEK